jgi:hypothetical protein
MPIRAAIEEFVERLHSLVESHAIERARAAVLAAFGAAPPKRRGRPPAAIAPSLSATNPRKRRKKAPLQLCPVPRCKNPAAPSLGMVCSKHRDVSKKLIAQYREARKAKKLGLAPSRVTKRRIKKVAAKPNEVPVDETTPVTA